MLRSTLHLALHLIVPAAVAAAFWRETFWRTTLTMWATMLVDLDHLFANPIYDAARCSIGFHPLHGIPAITAYGVVAFFKRTRVIAAGLPIHMCLDGIDCIWMTYAP